ncbi:MAG: hypothetical protein NTY19_14340, partial [Planctomycetota bacterium]|nr:hypothetical protein [Planctomycetota bacterium]
MRSGSYPGCCWARWLLKPCLVLLLLAAANPPAIAAETQASAAAVDLGQRMQALIEADWIASDQRLQPATGFSLLPTRAVVERGQRLLTRLQSAVAASRLEPLANELTKLDQRLRQLEAAATTPEDARRELYLQAHRVVRQIAWTNPLLNFHSLLFIERHDSGGIFHMCDQYYGCNAKPGGGLFVLRDPLGPQPQLVNLLEHSVVENGRLTGQQLSGGAFLSPELSYDGRTILFAYSQAQAKETYQWAPEYSYHIFKVNADGTGLVQLTDGAWDDFDPCWLPNGRIAFVSERRGGYLRCGRHCPVYTLHSMEPDGSDIVRLSYHETHEWNPSVTNDGMLVYSRWDYVDRDTNIAHHLWTSYPDGRDPRSFHGNYPVRRESRPWMEMRIRAIPGSNKFVASTGAHHGHEFGSLVLIDPRPEDDTAMSQLERLTPDVPFPEQIVPLLSCHFFQTYVTLRLVDWGRPCLRDGQSVMYQHQQAKLRAGA